MMFKRLRRPSKYVNRTFRVSIQIQTSFKKRQRGDIESNMNKKLGKSMVNDNNKTNNKKKQLPDKNGIISIRL